MVKVSFCMEISIPQRQSCEIGECVILTYSVNIVNFFCPACQGEKPQFGDRKACPRPKRRRLRSDTVTGYADYTMSDTPSERYPEYTKQTGLILALNQNISSALDALRQNPLRSFLTMLGIMIGVLSI